MKYASDCAGYDGIGLAVERVFGARLAWWADIEPAAQKVMSYYHPDAPNLGDLTVRDWSLAPRVDIYTAGYPCQPFSFAGQRKGTDDARHLWPYIAKGLRDLRPGIVILENVPGHRSKGFDVVIGDLAEMGYRVAWGSVRASDAGAPHRRERVYIVASDADPLRREWGWSTRDGRGGLADGGHATTAADATGGGRDGWAQTSERQSVTRAASTGSGGAFDWQQYADAVRRWERILGVDAPYPSVRGPRGGLKVSPHLAEWLMGVPGRITAVPDLTVNEQLKLAGNGVVPQGAEIAIRALLEVLDG